MNLPGLFLFHVKVFGCVAAILSAVVVVRYACQFRLFPMCRKGLRRIEHACRQRPGFQSPVMTMPGRTLPMADFYKLPSEAGRGTMLGPLEDVAGAVMVCTEAASGFSSSFET